MLGTIRWRCSKSLDDDDARHCRSRVPQLDTWPLGCIISAVFPYFYPFTYFRNETARIYLVCTGPRDIRLWTLCSTVSPRHSSGHLPLMRSPSILGSALTYVNATFEPRTCEFELRSFPLVLSLRYFVSSRRQRCLNIFSLGISVNFSNLMVPDLCTIFRNFWLIFERVIR